MHVGDRIARPNSPYCRLRIMFNSPANRMDLAAHSGNQFLPHPRPSPILSTLPCFRNILRIASVCSPNVLRRAASKPRLAPLLLPLAVFHRPSLSSDGWRLLARPASGAFRRRLRRAWWKAAARLEKTIKVARQNPFPVPGNYDVRRSIGRELHCPPKGPQRRTAQQRALAVAKNAFLVLR
jgi:hypothetical protein